MPVDIKRLIYMTPLVRWSRQLFSGLSELCDLLQLAACHFIEKELEVTTQMKQSKRDRAISLNSKLEELEQK